MLEKGKKNNLLRHRMLFAGILCLFVFCSLAQEQKSKSSSRAPRSKVYLLHSDLLRKDAVRPDAQIVVGNVKFRHDSMYMFCDSAYYYDKTGSFEAFSNVRMEQGDTLFIYGDHLFYDGYTQIAELRKNVRLENRNTQLYTDSLNYDRIANLGYYFDGGTLMDEENVLSSDWGEYSPVTKESVFNYNVKLLNPKFTMTSDTLHYNTMSKIARIVGPSNIVGDSTHIYSELGYYNTTTGKAQLLNRSEVTSGSRKLVADSIDYDRDLGVSKAFFDVVITDTLNKNLMTCEYGYYDDRRKYSFATDRAVAVDYSQGDSLFLHADTLLMRSFNLGTDSMYREMQAFHKSRFYRTDVQGVADSIIFNTKDSCLTLYRDPIVWNNNQQLLGERIHVYMNDSTIDWAHIVNQALSVELLDSVYNQVTGKEMKAYFANGQMRHVNVSGSVRLVYYPMEKDSTLIGMNVSETSELDMFLKEQKIEKIIMRPKSTGTLYPMTQIPAGKDKLDNFVWFDYIRPMHKNDIFEWRAKKAEDQLKANVRGKAPLPNQGLFDKKKE